MKHIYLTLIFLVSVLAPSMQLLYGQPPFSRVFPHAIDGKGDFRPFDGAKPLAVSLGDHFVYHKVLGGRTPNVVLYEDGLLVYRRYGKKPGYCFQQLSENQRAEFMRHIAPVFRSRDFQARHDIAPNQTSRPRTCYLFRDGKRTLITQVRGLYTSQIQPPPPNEAIHEVSTDGLPPELVAAHEFLNSVRARKGKEWRPRFVEVLLWPAQRPVRDKVVDWPAEWPDLKSDQALSVRDGLRDQRLFAVFVPGSDLADVQKLLAEDVDAVKLDGRQWQFAYRYVFPSEHVWRTPFNQPLMRAFRDSNED